MPSAPVFPARAFDPEPLDASGSSDRRRSRRAARRAWATRPPLWVTLIACAAILALRRPEIWWNPQFWAEDGVVFFENAWLRGWATLLEPYAGYLHTILRIVAALAVRFDPRWAPAVFVGGSALLTLYVAARTQSSRFGLPTHAGYALAVVLVPDVFEVLLFLVNQQWVLAGGLLALLVSADARRPRQWLHDTVAAVLLGLTGPFSLLFAPLFAWRAWVRRSVASTVLATLILACAAVQGWMIIKHPVVMPPQRIATEALLAVPGMRVAGSLLAGHRVPLDYPLPVEIALGVGTVVAIAALGVRRGFGHLERGWLALAFFLGLVGALVRCRYVLPDLCHASFGARYFFPLQLIALWLLVAATQDGRRWLARICAGVLLWSLALNFPRLREPGLTDFNWPAHAEKIGGGEAVRVPVNPEGWSFALPARKR